MAYMPTVIRRLRRAVTLQDATRKTDGQLLESFVSSREEAAFAALVRRHGPMVMGVCRRVIGSHHDAEDAFQATFLVLARKAPSIRPSEMVANWLQGVAYRTALKTRSMTAKRRVREKQVMEMPERSGNESSDWRDLQPLLDEELNALPDIYKLPIVICDLEGKTIKEATRQLGWPQGTLAGRLARGRKLLAKRLSDRGVIVATSMTMLIQHEFASASMPTAILNSTVEAAIHGAGPPAMLTNVVSMRVARLANGMLSPGFPWKFKLAMALLALGIIAGGGLLISSGSTSSSGTSVNVQDEEQVPAMPVGPPPIGAKKGNKQPSAERRVDAIKEEGGVRMFPNGVVHDFGKVPRGQVVNDSLPINNVGKLPLKFLSVRVSDGCLTAVPSKASLEPGQKGALNVALDTMRFTGAKAFRILLEWQTGDVTKTVALLIRANAQEGYIASLMIWVEPSEHSELVSKQTI